MEPAALVSSVEQLRDIRGLDPISWLPLASGWWILIGGLLAGIVVGLIIAWWLYTLQHDWRSDAHQQLRELRSRAHQLGIKEAAGQLAELLRRIAITRYGRLACANLTGEQWLSWLTQNDPINFQWIKHGRILIDLPYAPPRDQVRLEHADFDNLIKLIDAVLPWLKQEDQLSERPPLKAMAF